MRWLLLVYTVPSEPSRKRASVWRELKKLGAPYLRDGVCILPQRSETLAQARAIVAKVEEFGGEATLVTEATLDPSRSAALVEQFRTARADDYREIGVEADRLLEHIAREVEHRQFTYTELEELEADLNKLRRWTEQVLSRDYFGNGPPESLQAAFERCESALAAFVETAATQEVARSGTAEGSHGAAGASA